MSSSWQCPYCKNRSILTNGNTKSDALEFNYGNKFGNLKLQTKVVICKNPECREFTIETSLINRIKSDMISGTFIDGNTIDTWKLRPQSSAKPLPDYIPIAIREDYKEACLIQNLSPKASATLARRCLQGMLRDFWKVNERNLYLEIKAIENKVSTEVWEAIDVVRNIGNIGAHMEKDINHIIEVDENEADLLIGLIETLIDEWYINRHNRQQRLLEIKELGQNKVNEKEKLKNNNSV